MRKKSSERLEKERDDISEQLYNITEFMAHARELRGNPRSQTLKIKIASRCLHRLHLKILSGYGRQP